MSEEEKKMPVGDDDEFGDSLGGSDENDDGETFDDSKADDNIPAEKPAKPDDSATDDGETDPKDDLDFDSDEDVKDTPQPKEEEKPEAKEEPPAISDELRQQALDVGLDEEGLDSFTPESLQMMVDLFDRKLIASATEAEGESDSAKSDEKQPPEKKAEPTDEDLTPLELDIDADLFEPEVVAVLNGVVDHVNKVLGQVAEVRTGLKDRDAQAFTQWVDGQFTELDANFGKVFGKGNEADLAPGSDAFKNRGKVVVAMQALEAAYKQHGITVPSRSELFRRAVRTEFGDIEINSERQKVSNTLRAREGQFTKRPSAQHKNRETDPTRRAENAVREKWPSSAVGEEFLSEDEDFPD